MRFSKLVVAASALVFAACGGDKPKDAAPAAAPPAAAPPPAATGAPITGATEVVHMVGDANGMRFEPATITIKPGDGIRFEAVSMSPHNVSFDAAALSPAAKAALLANMPSQDLGELSGKILNDKDTYTISFANVPPGTYEAICTPHLAVGMKMKITVK
jgi:plastocyanin